MSETGHLDLDAPSRQALEFDAVLDLVAGHAATDVGKRAVRALRPKIGEEELERETGLVEEVRVWLLHQGALLSGGLPDPRAALERLALADAELEASALHDLCVNLRAAADIRAVVGKADRKPELLSNLVAPMPDLWSESAPVLEGVEPDGRIADGASPRLAEVRSRRTRVADGLRRKLEKLLRDPSATDSIQDEFVTRRNGRYVIPVRADAANPVRGIVHATSASGATRFVEPLDSVELNNELVELGEAERDEERRICAAWARSLRDRLEDVESTLVRLAEIDAIQARARYGERVDGVRPRIAAGAPMRLRGLRHPLLEHHLEQTGGTCVPLDLDLDPSDRILVVSGPNTGGKTVALKSVGLAVLMGQCGIPVVASEAVLPVYQQVRSDVGDHQSIDADLSTFSAHATAMAGFLESRRPPALFLFDEIGSGTDPGEGAALARAVLEHLSGPRVTIVATTHQNVLKQWAFGDEHAASAAMEFDDRTLRPTFRVLPGVVGHSAGLDIAARCGLPHELIDRARELLGEEAGLAEAYLKKLREGLADLDDRRAAWREERRLSEAELAGREREAREREEKRQAGMARQFDRRLAAFSRQAKRALAAIEDAGTRRSAERRAHAEERRLRLERERAVESFGGGQDDVELPRPAELREGQAVYVVSLGRQGTVRRVDGKRAEVQLGRIGITVDVDELRSATEERRVLAGAGKAAPRQDLESGPPTELMLIGQTVEAALDQVDRFLDRAVLGAASQVRLIHGHGTGKLRRAIRSHLRRHPLVRDYRAGAENEGGDGATIARLR